MGAMTKPTSSSQRSGAVAVQLSDAVWPADHVERWPIDRLIPYARNARTHSDAQVAQIAASLGRGDYHWQHEPAWYAVRDGGHWHGDRKQTTLWQISGRAQDAETVHGTQKPVECMRRPIENNSSASQAVYEPFCGSGTTIIAAEMAGRTCHAIELDPIYVDVAIRRWKAFTGQEAVLEEGGGSFCSVADRRGVALVTESHVATRKKA